MSKRKLDDYEDDDRDHNNNYSISAVDSSYLTSVRMQKLESSIVPSSSTATSSASLNVRSFSLSCTVTPPDSQIQFFVRIYNGRSLVISCDKNDTVEALHRRIYSITRIPVTEQRLIYGKKSLQWEQTLVECEVENDAVLQLLGRLRSANDANAWRTTSEMVSIIMQLCKGEMVLPATSMILSKLTTYFSAFPKQKFELAERYIDIFNTASIPDALIMLYFSSGVGNKDIAYCAIKHFLKTCKNGLPKYFYELCVPIVLKFCNSLRGGDSQQEKLYRTCRHYLGMMMEGVLSITSGLRWVDGFNGVIGTWELFKFVQELALKLSQDLMMSLQSDVNFGADSEVVRDFSMFLHLLECAIMEQAGCKCLILCPVDGENHNFPQHIVREVRQLNVIYNDIMGKMELCLQKVKEVINDEGSDEALDTYPRWSQYLMILKELNSIAKIYHGFEAKFWNMMFLNRDVIRALILRHAKRSDDNSWLFGHNDVTDFESRRHLALMMLHEIKDDYEELHEMLIDRPKLLEESFAYITNAEPEALHAGLSVEFKNEEATGPGVLREWFALVCKALFSQENALFIACQDDPRKFYPNPASKVNPLHLDYFKFCGRVIALALMYKVQVGVLFDRSFFMQLGGKPVTLEDTRDADPIFYNSCKKILEMDTKLLDSDDLGLTFVSQTEEIGSNEVVELYPGGKSIAVNGMNRVKYIDLLVQHRFVTSISAQLIHFMQGFNDMLCDTKFQGAFFENLEQEDFDYMLYGSEENINVEDWKAHTDYNGYKATDPEISWFWEIVRGMSSEQRKVLLFFWTSVKHLPFGGFHGLPSRLCISRSPNGCNRLPSSQTCFYRLYFPPYSSMEVMRDRLAIVTQEHVGCSFGTW